MDPIIKKFPIIGGKSKLIGLGPGTQEKEKCWPVEKFVELIDRLTKEDFKVLLFGSVADIERGQRIMDSVSNKDRVFNFINKTSLNEFAACVKYVNVYVTGDTGGMHIAYTMDVPVVAFFGPTDPVEALPQKNNIKYIWSNYECSPCSLKESHNCKTVECIRDISVERVKENIGSLL